MNSESNDYEGSPVGSSADLNTKTRAEKRTTFSFLISKNFMLHIQLLHAEVDYCDAHNEIQEFLKYSAPLWGEMWYAHN